MNDREMIYVNLNYLNIIEEEIRGSLTDVFGCFHQLIEIWLDDEFEIIKGDTHFYCKFVKNTHITTQGETLKELYLNIIDCLKLIEFTELCEKGFKEIPKDRFNKSLEHHGFSIE